ncbi:hypothetical protein BXZ70DRAFT_1006650 [Cristinia sonorae]|uniref:Uncharacterized protein n=1 Tax=Cristinia sonorae TaxID=1940300 RepID=A0A8K0XRX7_9AGAR|nr:hypothetical protein BXZ70DRAFT_1013325 [Cristinia sonorae]KAH8102752.1 hypothetical protein BXZ70DRAFT_1006650 [Cristinia sonorae]
MSQWRSKHQSILVSHPFPPRSQSPTPVLLKKEQTEVGSVSNPRGIQNGYNDNKRMLFIEDIDGIIIDGDEAKDIRRSTRSILNKAALRMAMPSKWSLASAAFINYVYAAVATISGSSSPSSTSTPSDPSAQPSALNPLVLAPVPALPSSSTSSDSIPSADPEPSSTRGKRTAPSALDGGVPSKKKKGGKRISQKERCKQDWREENPGKRVKEFDAFYAGLSNQDKKVWVERLAAKETKGAS